MKITILVDKSAWPAAPHACHGTPPEAGIAPEPTAPLQETGAGLRTEDADP